MSVIYTPFDKSSLQISFNLIYHSCTFKILRCLYVSSATYNVTISQLVRQLIREGYSQKNICQASTLNLKNNKCANLWSASYYLYNFSSCCRSYQLVVDKMYSHRFRTYFSLEEAESGGCCGDVDLKEVIWAISTVLVFGKIWSLSWHNFTRSIESTLWTLNVSASVNA